jgi:hypothetical protein
MGDLKAKLEGMPLELKLDVMAAMVRVRPVQNMGWWSRLEATMLYDA